MIDPSFLANWPAFFGYVFLPWVLVSFLNVVVWRKSWRASLWGRSHCEHCRHELNGLDLIPLFGYLLRRGRCAYCGQPIGLWHLVSEGVFLLGWYGLIMAYGWFYPWLPAILALFAYGYYLSQFDLRYRQVPRNETVLGFVVIAGVMVWAQGWTSLYPAGAMLLLTAGSALITSLITKKSLGQLVGLGDWWAAAMVALLFGIPNSWWVIMAACLLALAGTRWPVIGKRIPFVTMLTIASYLVAIATASCFVLC